MKSLFKSKPKTPAEQVRIARELPCCRRPFMASLRRNRPLHLLRRALFLPATFSRSVSVWSFGDNSSGALGRSSPLLDAYEPTRVLSLPEHIASFATGHYHSLAVTDEGQIWAWGRIEEGQLGRGLSFPRSPHPIFPVLSLLTMPRAPPPPPEVVAEYAKSGRSSCKGCNSSIAVAVLRVGLSTKDPRGWDAVKWHHFACFPASPSAQPIRSSAFLTSRSPIRKP